MTQNKPKVPPRREMSEPTPTHETASFAKKIRFRIYYIRAQWIARLSTSKNLSSHYFFSFLGLSAIIIYFINFFLSHISSRCTPISFLFCSTWVSQSSFDGCRNGIQKLINVMAVLPTQKPVNDILIALLPNRLKPPIHSVCVDSPLKLIAFILT